MDIYQDQHLISAEEEKIQDLQQIQADNNQSTDLLTEIVNSGSLNLQKQTHFFNDNEPHFTSKDQNITALDEVIDQEENKQQNDDQEETKQSQSSTMSQNSNYKKKSQKKRPKLSWLKVGCNAKYGIGKFKTDEFLRDTYQPGEDNDFEFEQPLVFNKFNSEQVKKKHQPSELEYYLRLWMQGKDCESEEFQHKYKTTQVFKNCAHSLKLPDNIPIDFKLKFKDHYLLRVVEIENAQRIIDEELEFLYNIKLSDNSTKYTGYHKKFVPECLGIMQSEYNLYQGEFKNGLVHGFGKLESTQERIVHIGEFTENEMDGWQLKICKDGTRYEGMYQKGRRIGRFIITSKSGETKEKYFDDNAINEEESDISDSDVPEIRYAEEGDIKYKINDRELIEIEEQDDPDLMTGKIELKNWIYNLHMVLYWKMGRDIEATYSTIESMGQESQLNPKVVTTGEREGMGLQMVRERKDLPMVVVGMRVNGSMDGVMELENSPQKIIPHTQEIGLRMKSMAKAQKHLQKEMSAQLSMLMGADKGKGIFTFKGIGIYEGEFVDDQIQGFGKITNDNGSSYEGYWKESQMNGQGKFIDEYGHTYEGNFVNDEQEGFGIMIWTTGEKYEGQWRNGQRHGEAWYTDSAGQRKKMLFDNDEQIRVLD
eukprot:403337598